MKNRAKLLLVSSRKEISKNEKRDWALTENHKFLIGRGEDSHIDLSFDPAVSRKHAEIWFKNNYWWIKHTGKYGTRINGEDIPENKDIQLDFDDKIEIGNKTTLVLSPFCRKTQLWEDSWIELEMSNSLNYALLYNGLPFFKQIVLHNEGKAFSQDFALRVKVGSFFNEEYDISSLKKGGSRYIDPEVKIAPDFFENQLESSNSLVEIFINNSVVFRETIEILAYNEWSMEKDNFHHTSLASFVQEEHPFVKKICTEIKEKQKNKKTMKMNVLIEMLYNYFKEECSITYDKEPYSPNSKYQRVRLPHDVLTDWHKRKGRGTCIDLSLLFASCLKNLGLHPLLILFKLREGFCHSIIGCWKERELLPDPLIKGVERIRKDVFMLDAISFTKNLNFNESEKKARKIFKNNKFLFALDIDAARRSEIKPLPFTGRPKSSPGVIRVSLKAKNIAEEIGGKINYKVYTPTHLLLSLLVIGEGFTIDVFKKCGVDLKESRGLLRKGLENVTPPKKVTELTESKHYREVWSLAFEKAKSEDVPSIYERHLFLALMEIPSGALDAAVKSLGLTRKRLKETASSLLKKKDKVLNPAESFFETYKKEKLLKSLVVTENILIPSKESSEKKKSEALLVLDICKSTEFIANYGDSVFYNLITKIGEILEYKGKQNQVEFLKSTGDGYFATFKKQSEALNVAFYSLRKLKEIKEKTQNNTRVVYPGVRIALNYGPVKIDGKGDRVSKAVHLVFRLEGVTKKQLVNPSKDLPRFLEKDRILISKDFYEKLKDEKVKGDFKYCGDYRLKGFGEPVCAYIYTGKI